MNKMIDDSEYVKRNEANYKRLRTRIHQDVELYLQQLNKGLREEYDNINYKDMIIISNKLGEKLANLDALDQLHEQTLHTPSRKWLNKLVFND